MEQSLKQSFDELERSGYMKVLRNLVKSHTCAFWWFDDSAPQGCSILHNGTITFINIGAKVIGITANHVYQEYLKDKAENPQIVCQIGGVTIEPERYVDKIESSLDIVSFELPQVLLAATRVTVHNLGKWPPKTLEQSDLVIHGGYPGLRREERIGIAQFDFVSFVSRIAQSSDDHISVSLELPNSHWPQGISIGHQTDLGGVSGGPVFRLITEPIEVLEFAGVIYEYSQTYELIFARHACQISILH